MQIRALIRLIRPWQWVKNLLIFLPAFFAQQIGDQDLWIRLLLGFLSFCLLSSMVYVLNDFSDRESDRLHPVKKNRPIASGEVSPRTALLLATALMILACLLSFFIGDFWFLCLMAAYLLNNLLYSAGLKKVALLDILIISIGFQIRIFAGGLLAGAAISKWLILMTFLGALMLSMGKRRSDLLLFREEGKDVPDWLKSYTPLFTGSAIVFLCAVSTVAYMMYTVSEEVLLRIGNEYVYLTNLFVIMGMLRYLQLSLSGAQGATPSLMFLRDPFLILMVFSWVATFTVLLYLT